MNRRIRPMAELENEIRHEMDRALECDQVVLLEVRWNMPDKFGCNWDVPFFQGDPRDVDVCGMVMTDFIRELQARFNVFDPN